MTSASTFGTPVLPTLPHWETPPADLKAAIREIKAALRARIAASGRTVEEGFAVLEARVAGRGARGAGGRGRGCAPRERGGARRGGPRARGRRSAARRSGR